MLRPTALLPLGLLVAGLALAQPAAATDYCVDVANTCDATNELGSFEAALGKADDSANADRIFLGAKTYTAPSAAGFDYQSGPVEVIGKGQGTTILTGSYPASQRVIRLMGVGTSIHDLTVHAPPGVTLAHEALTTDGVARRINVTEDPGQLASHVGVVLKNGGVLEDAVVQLGTDLETTGVVFDAGGGTVRDSIVIGRTAVESREGGTLERVRARGFNNGVITEGNVTTIRSSLIRVTGPIATGISALQKPGYNGQVHLDGVAVDGPGGGPGTTGVFAGNLLDPTHSVNVTIKNSIIRGFDKALNFLGFGNYSVVHATSSYSDYDVAKAKFSGPGAGITQTNITNVGDAGFANPATGNYHLLPGSALIDAGDPATLQGLDLEKRALVADGNDDGNARRDVGPFELPAPPSPTLPAPPPAGGGDPTPTTGAGDTQPPLITRFRTTRKAFAVGRARTAVAAFARGTRFRYTLSEDAKVTVKIVRRNGRRAGRLERTAKKGANRIAFSGRIGRRALKRGRYRAVIVATDAAGNRSAPRRVKFRVVY
jgi:hypothetical protein